MKKLLAVGICGMICMSVVIAHAGNLVSYPVPDRTNIPAFPGADGAGKYTVGGLEDRS